MLDNHTKVKYHMVTAKEIDGPEEQQCWSHGPSNNCLFSLHVTKQTARKTYIFLSSLMYFIVLLISCFQFSSYLYFLMYLVFVLSVLFV